MIGQDIFSLIMAMTLNKEELSELRNGMAKGNKAIRNLRSGNKSVNSMAKNLVLQYPCLFSSDCSFDTTELLTRALEHNYTTMLLLVINDAITASNADGSSANRISNVSDFLKQYHTNIDISGNGVLGTMNESYYDALSRVSSRDLNEACKILLNSPYDTLNLDIINESTIPEDLILNEAKGRNNQNRDKTQEEKDYWKNKDQREKEADARRKAQERINNEREIRRNKINKSNSDEERRYREERERKEEERYNKNLQREKDYAYTRTSLAKTSNLDFKKINNVVPTIINFDLIYETQSGNTVSKPAMFAVKAVAHSLRSEDIRYYLSDTVKEKNKLFRLIQWTSGEIKLVRDLILNSKKMKTMAVETRYKNTFWWRKLSSLAEVSKIQKLRQSDCLPVATSTMILTMNDVNAIKAKYGIDFLTNIGAVNKIMNTYFLLGFVVVDEGTERVYMYSDDSKSYKYYSFSSLSRYGKEKVSSKADAMELLKSLLN